MKKKNSARSAMSELLSKSNATQTKSPQRQPRPAARPQPMQNMQPSRQQPARKLPAQQPAQRTQIPVRQPMQRVQSPAQQPVQRMQPPVQQPAVRQPAVQRQQPARRQQAPGAQRAPQTQQRRMPQAAAPYPARKNTMAAQRRRAVKTSLKVVRVAVVLAALLVVTTGIISAVVLLNPPEPVTPDVSVGATAAQLPDLSPTAADAAASGSEPEAGSDPDAEPVLETVAPEGKYAVTFTFYDKEPVTCSTGERTVGELTELMHLELTEAQWQNVDGDAVITEDTTVAVDAVTYGTVNVTEAIPFETRYVDVQTIPRGSTRVDQAGQNGVRTYEYQITYLNGVEMDRSLAREYVSQYPTEKVITRGVGGTLTVGGQTYNYSYYIDCRATVYTGGGTTASGLPASERCIAVDPRVIPLGTQVYISGGYCEVGFRTAADTGGSIKGNIIDIYFENGNPYLGGWGWRDMRVYIF